MTKEQLLHALNALKERVSQERDQLRDIANEAEELERIYGKALEDLHTKIDALSRSL